MLAWYWGIVVFWVGAGVGSFLNVVISRLPLEKSLLWPGSRCGACYQPIRWYDNLPLISYLWLKGRCRTCGATFSIRYFLVEGLTGLGFVGLYLAELVFNIHSWPSLGQEWNISQGIYPIPWWCGFGFHAVLFSFLLAAAVCDLDGREIPLRLTMTGTVIGLIGATMMPWPWPWAPTDATPLPGGELAGPPGRRWPVTPGYEWLAPGRIKEGIQAWPVWGPLPAWLTPGGNWQTGLATGLAGLLVGTFLLRTFGYLFSKGLGKEALGLGDADLMMMAGAFLGWQVVAAGFFLSVIPGLVFGLVNMVVARDNTMPFGPSLAAGVLTAMLAWGWIGPYLQPALFQGIIVAGFVGAACVFLLISSFLLRMMRSGE